MYPSANGLAAAVFSIEISIGMLNVKMKVMELFRIGMGRQ